MLKKCRGTLIAGCIVCLIPLVVGLLLWDKLPDPMPTHFGADNEVNGWSSKLFAVVGIPLIMTGLELLVAFMTSADPRRRNINEKLFRLILWIVPVIAVFCCVLTYGVALGMDINIGMLVNILVGVIFIILGNLMHKLKQNYTVGIKLPWTLNSEENWNRTHRLGSWMFLIGGVLMIVNGFFQETWVIFVIVLLAAGIPGVYSYLLYRKGI